MKPPFWLRGARTAREPVVWLSRAALGSAVAAGLLVVGVAAVLDVAGSAPAAAFGAGIVAVSAAASWALAAMMARLARDIAPVLLAGYVVKAAVGVLLLLILPFPGAWSGIWALTAAVVSVAASLGTQVWAIGRLRIPYFSAAETTSAAATREQNDHRKAP